PPLCGGEGNKPYAPSPPRSGGEGRGEVAFHPTGCAKLPPNAHKRESGTMTTILRRLLPAAFATAALLVGAMGTARALTQDEVDSLSGPDRQKTLEEGAKKEGVVTFYTSLIVDQIVIPMKEAFEKKYPFIKFEYYRAETAELM